MKTLKHIKQYAAVARTWATASTCARLHVGAVIVAEGRILATGYNGTAAGCSHHCKDKFKQTDILHYVINEVGKWEAVSENEWKKKHHEYAEQYEVHAEQNAIFNMLKTGTNIMQDSTLICTHEPCINCAKAIVSVGIRHVVYIEPYDRNDGKALEYLKEFGVTVDKYVEG